jgi:hypothetical protein
MSGCTAAGQIGIIVEICEDGIQVDFNNGESTWKYAEDMLERMCPLCPQDLTDATDDQCYPLENDFFGSACQINGVACCETCYNVHMLTSDEPQEESCKQLWKKLYGKARAKGYGIYCGYNGRNIAITGHADGWNHPFSADQDGLERAQGWLSIQAEAPSEEERIEAKAAHWVERKAIESDYIQRDW